MQADEIPMLIRAVLFVSKSLYFQQNHWKIVHEHEFSLTCMFPYKHKIYNSIFIPENTGEREPVFCNVLFAIFRISS